MYEGQVPSIKTQEYENFHFTFRIAQKKNYFFEKHIL